MEAKRVFISYSWSGARFEDWVVQLAMRLVQDGVDVKLDKWDLKEGHDKYHFMEQMVTSSEIYKVLIILDEQYAAKADSRKGGVGTETLIITPKLYENTAQEKFIPIVAETNENGQAFLPAYMSGRIYIDLSSQEHFETNYEKLLRNIYNRPSLSKPKLGNAPKYLFEDSPVHHKTTTMARSIDASLDKNPIWINSLLRDFLDQYFDDLREFKLGNDAGNTYLQVGEKVFDLLSKYRVMKEDYLNFINKVLKSEVAFDFDIIIHFFESLPLLFGPVEDESQWSPAAYEHFKLITHELFLYTVGIALVCSRYDFLEHLFYSGYLLQEKYSRSSSPVLYTAFRYYYSVMDEYYKKLKSSNFYSVHADFIIETVPEIASKDLLTDADLLCYFVAKLQNMDWFPITYIYRNRNEYRLEIISRLTSKKHFQKVKGVLGFETIEKLKAKVTELDAASEDRSYSLGRESIPKITKFIKIDQIGTLL